MKNLAMTLILSLVSMFMVACGETPDSFSGTSMSFAEGVNSLEVGVENNDKITFQNCSTGVHNLYYEANGLTALVTQVHCTGGVGVAESFDMSTVDPSLIGGVGTLILEGENGVVFKYPSIPLN